MKLKYPDNKYTQEKYEAKLKLVDELNSLTDYKFTLDETSQDGYETINMVDAPISVNHHNYQNHYSFYLNYKLPFVNWDAEKQIAEKYTKPNNVGVLSKSKISAWVDYLTKIYIELVDLSNKRSAKVDAFVKEAINAGIPVKQSTREYGNKNDYSGRVVKNGISYEVEISGDNGYISQKIEKNYSVDNSLEAFLQLSDNKYIAKKQN